MHASHAVFSLIFLKSLHLALSACLCFILGHPLDYNAFIYNNNPCLEMSTNNEH